MDVGEDWISELPESSMLHILSFLPTKLAVSTTVLSKRWKNLWMSMPVFDFHYRGGHDPWRETKRFMDFLDKTLFYFDMNRVRKWITALILRKVEELVLTMRWPGPKLAPPELFNCASLPMLEINFEFEHDLDIPKSISLPRLKVLQLSGVEFNDMASMQKLLSNCPILEKLILCKCTGKDLISFSAPLLKYFTLEGYALRDFHYNLKVEIDAPNLVSIKFGGWLPRDFPEGSFPSLAEVEFLRSSGDKTTTLDPLSKLVRMCSNVKLLKASNKCLRIFDIPNVPATSFPTFDNLMRLEVDYHDVYDPRPSLPSISSLFNFLHSSPNLESLVVNKVNYTQELNGNELTLDSAPHCLLLRLKSIEFQNFDGTPKEMELVKLFLEHAGVLDQLVVTFRNAYSSTEMIKKLGSFPRASTHCNLQAFKTKST